jgi:N-methylhydantoinase A
MVSFRTSYAAEMRYEGQGYDVPVVLEQTWLADGDRAAVGTAFHHAHRAVYGHASDTNEVWLKELRVHIAGTLPRPRMRAVAHQDVEPATRRMIRLSGQPVDAAVLSRSSLRESEAVQGPAIINQMDTTTLILPGWQASLEPAGALILRRVGAEASR